MPTFPTVTCHQCVTGLFCSLIGVSNLLTLGCDIAIYSEHCRTDYTRDPCNQVTINNQRKVSVLSKFTIMCRITFRVNPGYKSATGVHTCNSLSHSLLYQHDFMTVTEVLSPSLRDGEMDYLLRVLDALPEDPTSIPSTYMRWFTAACHSRSRGSDVFFWTPGTSVLTHALNHMYIMNIIENK